MGILGKNAKLQISYPIIVEGKHDRERVLAVAQANVIVTDGFGVFRQKEKADFFRRIAEHSKIIVLTDSDGAGQVIRGYFRSILPAEAMIHLYTSPIYGKGARKTECGILGVEDTDFAQLRQILRPYEGELPHRTPITRADLYDLGLSGHSDSGEVRRKVLEHLGLPPSLTGEGLAQALTMVASREELVEVIKRV